MTERDPVPGSAGDAVDGGDEFDRTFEAHFRAMSSATRPAADRRDRHDRSPRAVQELASEIEDRYPDPDDPKWLKRVKPTRASASPIESRKRRAVRGTLPSDGEEVDDTPAQLDAEPVPTRKRDPKPEKHDVEIASLEDLDRVLGLEDDDTSEDASTPAQEEEAEIVTAYMPQPKTVDHCTPPVINRALVRLFPDRVNKDGTFEPGVDLDPCASTSGNQIVRARHYCHGIDHGHPDYPRRDGLAISWADLLDGVGVVYINPPYFGKVLKQWTDKAIDEVSSADDLSVIGLLPVKAEQPWFHENVIAPDTAAAVALIKGRLQYIGNDAGATFASMVVLWTLDDALVDRFEKVFAVDIDEQLGRPLGRVLRIPRS